MGIPSRSASPAVSSPSRRSRLGLYVSVVAIVVAAGIVAGLAVQGAFTPSSSSSPTVVTMVADGTLVTVPAAGQWIAGPFDLTGHPNWGVNASFMSNPGVGFYVLNSSDYSLWNGSGGLPTQYSIGFSDSVSLTYYTIIPTGTYHVVFLNPSSQLSATVTVETLNASAVAHLPPV